MHISRVDLNLLVVLETIYTEGGITRAAEKLHLTQPAISHALARLRELFNDPLFERQGHKMVPTPLAQRLIDPLKVSLQSIGSLLNGTQRFDPATAKKKLVVAMSGPVEAAVMPPLMRALALEAPGVSVASVRVRRSALESELAAGTLDLAIDVLLTCGPAVRVQRVNSDALLVMARKGHPKVKGGKGQIDLDTYLAQRHVLVTGRRQGLGVEDLALRRLGHVRDIAMRCQSWFAACSTVAQSDLLLTTPRGNVRSAGGAQGNQLLEMPGVLPSVDAYMYWHGPAEEDGGNRWLRELVGRCFGGEGAGASRL